jgi:hypothetical protein
VNRSTSKDEHERARSLIVLAGPEALSLADQTWLATHVEACTFCHTFAENMRQTVHALRAIPIAAERSLVSTTQMMVRRRALELQRQRERMWLVSISCIAVTLCALISAVALWRGFEWLGERADLAPAIWQVGFLVFCLMPALIVGILLLARDAHLANHTGSYQG